MKEVVLGLSLVFDLYTKTIVLGLFNIKRLICQSKPLHFPFSSELSPQSSLPSHNKEGKMHFVFLSGIVLFLIICDDF